VTTTTVQLNGSATFARGVHPPEGKHFSENMAIEVLPAPEQVRIPLIQHIGAPCKAILKPRTEVAVGDVLGEAGGFVSSPVHSSISGKTAKATAVTLPNGRHVPVVPVKADPEQPSAGQELFDAVFGGDWPKDIESYEPKQIVEAIQAGGLVGLGGAAFPTHVKFTPNKDKPIQVLLVNGCECEPYLTADYRLMIEAPAPVVTGALLAQKAAGAAQVVICVEDNKPEAIASLRKAANGTAVQIKVMKTKYPQGGEKQLIMAVMGLEVPTGGLPLDVGVVVMNVSTSAALAGAVVRKRPLTHRIISVTGAGIKNPKNLLVPIGTDYGELIDYCGGITQDAARVVAGGPMMGFTLGQLDVPVTKGTSGITVLTHVDVRKAAETACVRCGRCVDICPLRLIPTKIALGARVGVADVLERYAVSACMECGCCAYTCPASLPLVQLIRIGKIILQKAQKK